MARQGRVKMAPKTTLNLGADIDVNEEGSHKAPIAIRITGNEITFSARIEESVEPSPGSLEMIKRIDSFLHAMVDTPATPGQPEKIVFFLRQFYSK